MRTLIVDDERLARQELTGLLGEFAEIEIIGEASNADEALSKIENEKPELIFLDIQMPGKNGFELLSSLGDYVPEIIFTTAYDEYALKAFEFNATDYLLKPIDPKRLAEAIQRVDPENLEASVAPMGMGQVGTEVLGENDNVFVKDGDKCWFIRLNTVRLFESVGNYVRIHFENQRALILRSLNALDNRLDPKVFFRANRKFIINLKMINKIEPYFNGGFIVHLHGGERVEISRRQAVRFKELLSL